MFLGGYVLNNLKGKKLFSDQMDRNRLELILTRHGRNRYTVEKLRCPYSAVNETF